MTPRDPVELLREIASRRREHLGDAPNPELVLQRVHNALNSPQRKPRRTRRRRGIVAGIVVTALGTGGGVAWAITHHKRATNPTLITCHQTANLDSSQIVVSDDGSDPVQLCAHAWTADLPEWGTPPPMVACILQVGNAAVFPGDERTCDQLGLTPLDSTLTDKDQALIKFQDELTTELAQKGCIPPDEMKSIIVRHLAASNLVGWSVNVGGPFTPAMPCGSLAIDVAAKSITVRPLPDIFTSNTGG